MKTIREHLTLSTCQNHKRAGMLTLVVSRYTEIPNRYPIFSNTDTHTDVGILNTENTENSVRYSLPEAVNCVTFETEELNQSY